MTHVHEDIGAYALGALDEESTRRVAQHLKECPQCAAAHAEVAGLPALLDLAVVTGATDEEPLPPAIEERLLDRFARENPANEPPRRRGWHRLGRARCDRGWRCSCRCSLVHGGHLRDLR